MFHHQSIDLSLIESIKIHAPFPSLFTYITVYIIFLELSSVATDMESNISEIKTLGKADKQYEAEFQVNSNFDWLFNEL